MDKDIVNEYLRRVSQNLSNCWDEINKEETYPDTWSKDDDEIVKDIIEYLECWNDFDCGDEPFEEYCARFEKYIEWMKQIKNRVIQYERKGT